MNYQETEAKFVNGVRVATNYYVGYREPMREYDDWIVDQLTHICRQLGALWSVEHTEGHERTFYLNYNGGHATRGGLVIHVYATVYVGPNDDYRKERGYDKFKIAGSYPATPSGCGRANMIGAPEKFVTITGHARVAAFIKQIVPKVQEITDETYRIIDMYVAKEEAYYDRRKFLCELAGGVIDEFKLEPVCADRTEVTIPYGEGVYGGATVANRRDSGIYEVELALHSEEVSRVIGFIYDMRKAALAN